MSSYTPLHYFFIFYIQSRLSKHPCFRAFELEKSNIVNENTLNTYYILHRRNLINLLPQIATMQKFCNFYTSATSRHIWRYEEVGIAHGWNLTTSAPTK